MGPESRRRASQITSIAPIAVEVRVSSTSLFRDDEVRPDWSDTARADLMRAIAKHFGQDPRFALKDWHPEDTEAIRQDLERVRYAIEAIRATTADLGGWKSETMRRRYASLTNETLRAAAEAVAAHGAPARLALATASGNRRGSRRYDKRR